MAITLSDGRAELYQWDTARELTIDGVPDATMVHFSTRAYGRTVDVEIKGGKAKIPDFMLQTPTPLSVYVFVGTTEAGYTKIEKTYEVKRRNKPAEYVYTPTEQTTLQEAIYIAQDAKAVADSVRADADAGKFDGKDGTDGYTPVKGVDYWTPSEAAEMDAAKTAANNAADNASVAEAAALNAASAADEAASSASISAQNADTAAGEARAKAEDLQAKADAGDFNGEDGYTPVRGTDYWTDADKAAINADIAAQVAGKVDKVDGKGLSSNDYTDADKAAVAKIPFFEKTADLLFTTTFEVETTAWNLTKIDGKAFELTSALVEFICPAAAVSGNINLGVYGVDISQYYQVAGGIKTTPNNSSVYAACENGIGIVMVRNTGTNSTKTQTNASIGVIPLLKNIVRLYSGSTFPAGTTINVYGKNRS